MDNMRASYLPIDILCRCLDIARLAVNATGPVVSSHYIKNGETSI